MKEYRLKIKYPIGEYDSESFIKLYQYNGKNVFIDKHLSKDIVNIRICGMSNAYRFDCEKSWIEEVKESDFDKWHSTVEGGNLYSAKENRKEGWQASQKNRDLLYKEFIELYEDFLHQDFELLSYHTSNSRAKEILKVLNKTFKNKG